ncbi:MAG: cytochrome P450, partial [Steroidobacteraceae bacterium]
RRFVGRFASIIAEENDSLAARWEAQAARGDPINVTESTSELTLRIVLRCIFGDDTPQLLERFALVTHEPARNLEFVYKFRALARSVVELVRRRHDERTERLDYVALLMSVCDKQTGAAMSERQLVDEIMTLVVAGHETTASVLNWTWYLLSRHSDTQERLRAEVRSQVAVSTPSLTQLDALVFMRQVLDETMRLYPPGWLLSRRAIGPDVLGGYSVPAGVDVLLPLYLVQRDPRFWIDPDEFRPERFSPEWEAERPRFAYQPFGAGPRRCIGEPLALYEMLMHLYKMAGRFRLRLVTNDPPELEAGINLRSRHPIYMRTELSAVR